MSNFVKGLEVFTNLLTSIAVIIGGYYLFIISIWNVSQLYSLKQDDFTRLNKDLMDNSMTVRPFYNIAIVVILGIPLFEITILKAIINIIEYLTKTEINWIETDFVLSGFLIIGFFFYYYIVTIKRNEKVLEINVVNKKTNKKEKWYLVRKTDYDDFIFSKYLPRHGKGINYGRPNLTKIKIGDLRSFSKEDVINHATSYVYISDIPKTLKEE